MQSTRINPGGLFTKAYLRLTGSNRNVPLQVLILVSTIPVSVYVALNPNPSPREQINSALIGFYIFDNSLIIFGILTVQTLLFLTYLTIRASVQKKLQEAKANLTVNRRQSRHFTNTIVQESKKEFASHSSLHDDRAGVLRYFFTQ